MDSVEDSLSPYPNAFPKLDLGPFNYIWIFGKDRTWVGDYPGLPDGQLRAAGENPADAAPIAKITSIAYYTKDEYRANLPPKERPRRVVGSRETCLRSA